VIAVRPMKDGVIADFDVTEKMLRYFLALIIENHVFKVKPRVIVCVPSGITEVEKRAVRDSALGPAQRKSSWSPSRWRRRSGRSAGRDSDGNMVIDIGGGTTEIAVIALSESSATPRSAPAATSSTWRSCSSCARTTTARSGIDGGAGEDPDRSAYPVARNGDGVKGRDLVSEFPRACAYIRGDSGCGAGADSADCRRCAARAGDHAAELAADIVDRGSS
jgi:rod shape-determining protein MreB